MPNFKYKAISLDGAKVSGVITAYDEFEAVNFVKQTGHVVTSIKEVDGKKQFSLNMTIGNPKIKEKVLALMCSQFSIVLKAGMPIVRSVELIATQTADKPLRELLSKVAEDVATGYGLAQSFENKGANTLPTTFIETIRAGQKRHDVSDFSVGYGCCSNRNRYAGGNAGFPWYVSGYGNGAALANPVSN